MRFFALALLTLTLANAQSFRAGAAQSDITPTWFPVTVNCFMTERQSSEVIAPIFAKAIVLENGLTKLAIVVVDSCMLPRELIDQTKALVQEATGIDSSHQLISATHTHMAPAAMACLGSDADARYAAWLPARIAQAIIDANKNLQPAQAGASKIDDYEHTFNRRFIYRPDKMLTDPFGVKSVRANMHPGYQNPDAIGPSGPVDPALTVLAIQTLAGKPIAVLANYSMHYFDSKPISPDYFGIFEKQFAKRVNAPIVLLSQGTAGDLMWMDYSKPKREGLTIEQYTEGLVNAAERAYKTITYDSSPSLAMEETERGFNRRVPLPSRLGKWKGGKPKNQVEVYQREQDLVAAEPHRDLKLQALRIGPLAIAAWPNEVFAISGLKLKEQSPFPLTMNISLANGAEGYIPPPEQHALGGYTTWLARSASLEVDAEPRILGSLLDLIDRLDPSLPTPHKSVPLPPGALAYWPLDNLDSSGLSLDGNFAFAVPGKDGPGSRSLYFAGGELTLPFPKELSTYEIDFWIWPGMTQNSWLLSRLELRDNHLYLAGQRGATPIPTQQWTRVTLRTGTTLKLSVNGKPELSAPAELSLENTLIIGRGFEGRMDEIVLRP